MVKRIISVLLTLFIFGSLLAGCGGSKSVEQQTTAAPQTSSGQEAQKASEEPTESPYGDTGGLTLPIVDKPVTIKWFVASDQQTLNDKPVIKEIQKRTGVKLDMQVTPIASAGEKLNILLASGDLLDIMTRVSPQEYNVLGTKGVLAAINQYLDIIPNFKRIFKDTPENSFIFKSYAAPDGNLYMWPVYNLNRDVNFGWLYRKDVFDKLGIPMWNNTDEFYQALKRLKEAYPESYPVTSKDGANTFNAWAPGWGIKVWFMACHDRNTNTWSFAYTTPQYKELLDFMKKLYNEGLLDPEFLTNTMAAFQEKLTADAKCFIAFDWIGWMENFYNQVKDKKPDFDLRAGNPVGPSGCIEELSRITDFGICVTKNENTEIALKLMDYLMSPSGSELVTMGIRGVHFTLDENGKPVYPDFEGSTGISIRDLEEKYGCWVETMYLNPDRRSVYYNFTPREQEAQDVIMKERKLIPLPPLLVFTQEETERMTEYNSILQSAFDTFAAQYVMDPAFGEAQWEEWLNKAKNLGADEYIAIFNEAQRRFDASE